MCAVQRAPVAKVLVCAATRYTFPRLFRVDQVIHLLMDKHCVIRKSSSDSAIFRGFGNDPCTFIPFQKVDSNGHRWLKSELDQTHHHSRQKTFNFSDIKMSPQTGAYQQRYAPSGCIAISTAK